MIQSIDLSRIKDLSFFVRDVPYHVTHKKDTGDGEAYICIHAVLGYLPFSVESPENRDAIMVNYSPPAILQPTC